jgi:hypothetical protein
MDKPRLDQGPDYERGFIDGMMYQTQTTVNKAVNAMSSRTHTPEDVQKIMEPWVGLTELEKAEITSLKWWDWEDTFDIDGFIKTIEAKLKEKNT